MAGMQSLRAYISADPRAAYKKEIVCTMCGGIHKDVYDKNMNFLYSTPCECEEQAQKQAHSEYLSNLLYGEIAIAENRARCGFTRAEQIKLENTFVVDSSNKEIYNEMMNWVADFGEDTHRGFLLVGKPGTGKTRLALEMAEKLLAKGIRIYFTTAQRYLNDVKRAFNEQTVMNVQKIARECTVLFIDDLGAEQGTTFDKAEVLELINDRAGAKPIIMTTNLNREGLDKFYDGNGRISSRIIDSVEKIYTVAGRDRRAVMYKQRNATV